MSEHTSGPWAVGDTYYHPEYEAKVSLITHGDDGCVAIVLVDGQDDPDARLIAAAPDLLAVAKIFAGTLPELVDEDSVPLFPEDGGDMKLIRAAIAKAEGEKHD